MSAPQSSPPDTDVPEPARGRTRDGGVSLGRAFGVPLVVAPSWFVVAALLTVLYEPSVRRAVPDLGAMAWLVSFGYAVLLYVSVLAHELGHALTALRLHLQPRRITLHILGGFTEFDRPAPTPRAASLVSVAGPAVNLVLAAIGWLVLRVTEEGTVVDLLAYALMSANLVVGVFNLLPGLPLDGGHLLEAGVWRLTGARLRGTVAAAVSGRVLAGLVLVLAFGFTLAHRDSDGGTPVMTLATAILLSSFIWAGANSSLAGARLRSRIPQLTTRTLARRAIPVPRELSVAEAVRRAQEAGVAALVVVDAQDRPVAVVDEAAVRAMPETRRPWVSVENVARRLGDGLVLSLDLAGDELLAALWQRPASEYLVVDADELVVGVLTRADVEAVLAGTAPRRP